MDIIGKAFNPTAGNARAACVEIDDMIIGIITHGDDAEDTIASFNDAVQNLDKDSWSKGKDIWNNINTTSPFLMFCRKRSTDDDSLWGNFYHKNISYVMGEYPDSPYALDASMTGLCAALLLNTTELAYPADFLQKENFNFYVGKDVVVLSTAPYNRANDWEQLNKTVVEAVKPLCCDHPEEHWDDAGKVLFNSIAPDHAHIIIVNADDCRKRVNWNIPDGEPTRHQLKIEWSKRGWELMNSEWDEHTTDIVRAKTGCLYYEEFFGLCITEITDNKITLRRGTQQYILTPGESLNLSENDSYEDHEGVEHRDIDYELNITWLQGKE